MDTDLLGWRPNLKGESDNQLIELAVAGGASKIVTANIRDFVRAELPFPGTPSSNRSRAEQKKLAR